MRRFLVVPTLLSIAAAANAQISWSNPVSGNWSDPAAWVGGNVPDNAGESASIAIAGTYSIAFDLSTTIGGLALTNANATVGINAGQTMAIGGGTWTNNGLLIVNPTGANAGTSLRSDISAVTLNGSGILRLNANAANLDTAVMPTFDGNRVVTLGPSQTLDGSGRVRIALTNSGHVDANLGGRTLELLDFSKTNNGIMRAINGGTLQFSNISVQNAGGTIVADGLGSNVVYNSSTVVGGGLSATNNGASSFFNSAITSATLTGTHSVLANSTLALAGGITNNGLIVVNNTGANQATSLRLDVAGATIAGNGVIRLNAHNANLDTSALTTFDGSRVLTIGVGQTLDGTGRERVALVNDGLVDANVAGQTLEMLDQGKTNHATMRATNGGTLQFSNIGLQNAGGLILANGAGSNVVISATAISGGELRSTSGGVSSFSNSSISGTTLTNEHNVAAGTGLAIVGSGFTNNGLLVVNPTGTNAATSLRIDVPNGLIAGDGVVRLNANAANLDTAAITTFDGSRVVTLGPDQTLDGMGRVRASIVNNGLIDANVAGQTLDFRDQAKTNNNTMRATNGATLSINSTSVTQSPDGITIADGANSAVSVANSTMTGGEIGATNGGKSSFSNSNISGVTLTGNNDVAHGASLAMIGSFTNDGVLLVNDTGENSSASLRIDVANATIDGNGVVRLNANAANLDTAVLNTFDSGRVITLGADQTLDGTGRVRASLTNEGLVDANVSGHALELRDQVKTNHAMMQATNGGTLQFVVTTVQNASGLIDAAGAGSTVIYDNTTILDGILSSTNGGTSIFSNAFLSGATLTGSHVVASGTALGMNGSGFTNNGTLVVNENAANQGTSLRIDTAAITIGGTGTVQLNAHAANLDTALLQTFDGGRVITFGPGQTLAGLGRTRTQLVHQGVISPGAAAAPVGQIDILGPGSLTMAPTSEYRVDLGGVAAGQYDRVTGNSGVAIDGTLSVSLINGYTPVLGDEFTIMSVGGVNGQFENIEAPTLPAGSAWRVRYTASSAILTVTCPPDLDGDHVIGLTDLAFMLSNYGLTEGVGSEDGDLDGDGDVDIQDLARMLSAFGNPC